MHSLSIQGLEPRGGSILCLGDLESIPLAQNGTVWIYMRFLGFFSRFLLSIALLLSCCPHGFVERWHISFLGHRYSPVGTQMFLTCVASRRNSLPSPCVVSSQSR